MAQTYLFDRFRLDAAARQLLRDGEPILLSSKAFDTLLALIASRSRVVSKEELIGLVWPDKNVSEDLLPQNILAVRRTLGDDSTQPTFIATIPRRGYQFIAPVTEVSPETSRRSVGWTATAWTGVAAVASIALALTMARRPAPAATLISRPLRFAQRVPDGTTLASGGQLSPNGRYLAFVAEDDMSGIAALWVRALDTGDTRALNGTEDAVKPFWSPDSQSLGFFANGKLKRVGLEGNPPRTIADVSLTPGGGTWSPRGIIVFANWKSGLSAVADTGGTVTAVTALNRSAREVAHSSPQFLPDGRHLLYFVSSSNPEKAGTYAADLDSSAKTRAMDSAVTYAAPGYLLAIHDNTVMAQRFDADRLQRAGSPGRVASNVPPGATVSASDNGLMAIGGAFTASTLVWFNRSGIALSTINAPAHLHNPAFSPDLKQIIASSTDTDQPGLWTIDVAQGAPTRFTPYGTSPWASPDGQRIVFTSDRAAGVADMYARSSAGRGDEEVVLRTDENKIVNDWSPDGRYIVYVTTNAVTRKDLWLLPQFGAKQPIPYLQTPSNEIQGRVSPDGRWMAYASDESGAWQVYVQTFPVPGGKRVVSVSGGAQPQWRHDGRELFYLAPNHTMMAVDITLGETAEPGQPHALFRADVAGQLNTYRSHYAVTADGQRFVIDSSGKSPRSITMLVNWTALIKP